MRRYMGNTWLSVREAANLLHVPEEAVLRMIANGLVSCIWRCSAVPEGFLRPSRSAYLSKVQVDEMALRFAALDAVFADWDNKVTEVFGDGGLKEV